jgi:DNA mismatch endonuclease (patch repair protein)
MERALRMKLPGGRFTNVDSKRSRTMSAIRGKGNKSTEVALRLGLVRARVRGWAVHPNGFLGSPDFLFKRKRVAVFVDGCFWHGCARCGHLPKSNRAFWRAKILKNQARARKIDIGLRKEGYRVTRFWEHAIKSHLPECINRLQRALHVR